MCARLYAALLSAALLPTADALWAQRTLTPLRRRCHASAVMTADDGASLAAQFAAERARRAANPQQQPDADAAATPKDEPFSGIKEVVLDGEGRPQAIPKRPPPPPSTSQTDEIKMLVQNPLFAFGSLLSLGSAVLLLAIAAADDAAF